MKTLLLLSLALCLRCFAPTPLFFGLNQAPSVAASADFDPTGYGLSVNGWWAPRKESGFADNDAIGSLTDWSGNSRTATQGTSTAKPTYKTGVSGVSLPVSYHDGGDYLTSTSFTQAQGYTMALVAKSASGGANNAPFGSAAGYTGLCARSDGKWLAYAGGSTTTYGTSTSWSVIVAVFNGASSFIYINGTKTSGSFGTSSLSSGVALGAWNGLGEPFVGHIGEWVLWSGAMSDANAAAACAALQTQWGL